MLQYRVYAVGVNGGFLSCPTRRLTANHDVAAMQQALVDWPDTVWAVEVWTANRLVAFTTRERAEVEWPAPVNKAPAQIVHQDPVAPTLELLLQP